jgi:hypothetical protein
MPTDDVWISLRITEARKCYPLVTEAVVSRLDGMLRGRLSQRQLPRGELTSIASALIADMVAAPPESDERK